MSPKLPPEVYYSVADYTSSASTLSKCCLVSKEFYEVFVPRLWRQICISYEDSVPTRVLQSPNLNKFTHSLRAAIGTTSRDSNEESITEYVKLLPNLTTLTLE